MKILFLYIVLLFSALGTNACLFFDDNASDNSTTENNIANNGFPDSCGDGNFDATIEACDAGLFRDNESCETYKKGSIGTLMCTSTCIVNPANCTLSVRTCPTDVAEGAERCNPELDVILDCGENYVGEATCNDECVVDRTNCTPIYSQISAGGLHTCGLRPDGSVRCWGDNEFNQVSGVPPNVEFTKISAGGWHTCGITIDMNVICWGRGQGTAPGGGYYTDISSSVFFSCGISNNEVICWGTLEGPEGDPVGPPPTEYFNNPSQISSGREHACALYDQDGICWGANGTGQDGFTATQVAAGDGYNCFLNNNNNVLCEGRNSGPQRGASGGPPANTRFNNIVAGRYHACGLLTDNNKPFCWGTGLGEIPLIELRQISAGDFHTCGLALNGKAVCWGIPPDSPTKNFRRGQVNVPKD